MNIKDYIHYYLGQPCVNSWYPEDHYEYNKGWIIRMVDPRAERFCFIETEDEETWTDSVKPILRRPDSLTDDEAYHLNKISPYFNSLASEKYIRDRLHVIKKNMADFIGMTPVRVHYLLSLGIDLFGLLDAGLAVDAETLKTGSNA